MSLVSLSRFVRVLTIVAALGGCLSRLRAADASPAPLPQVDLIASAKSVFIDSPTFGKDPFFPRSTRRGPQVVAPATNSVPVPEVVPDLFLNGIAVHGTRRLVIVNNTTLDLGEETVVKVNGRSVKVRCLEIREKSVLLSVQGQPKELFLRKGAQ